MPKGSLALRGCTATLLSTGAAQNAALSDVYRQPSTRVTGEKLMMRRTHLALRGLGLACLAAVTAGALVSVQAAHGAGGPCGPPIVNPVACENTKPGNPPSEWDVSGAGDPSIQGFATDISVDQGQTVHFKVKTDAAAYHLDVY